MDGYAPPKCGKAWRISGEPSADADSACGYRRGNAPHTHYQRRGNALLTQVALPLLRFLLRKRGECPEICGQKSDAKRTDCGELRRICGEAPEWIGLATVIEPFQNPVQGVCEWLLPQQKILLYMGFFSRPFVRGDSDLGERSQGSRRLFAELT